MGSEGRLREGRQPTAEHRGFLPSSSPDKRKGGQPKRMPDMGSGGRWPERGCSTLLF